MSKVSLCEILAGSKDGAQAQESVCEQARAPRGGAVLPRARGRGVYRAACQVERRKHDGEWDPACPRLTCDVTDLTLVQECEGPDGETLLCWLPNKFSKVVWAQRGDFLIVAPQSPDEGNTKISATISHILFPEQVSLSPPSLSTSLPTSLFSDLSLDPSTP